MPTGSDLGRALRAWRARVAPHQAGFPAGGDRRVPGLRREELAPLAGISVDYLVRLEQGRALHPSPPVLGALARALRLAPGERDVLYRLAATVPPPTGPVPRALSRAVGLMVDRMDDTPVAVFTAAWDLVRWNRRWAARLGDPAADDGHGRNLVWRHFAHAGASRVHRDDTQTDAFERELVSDLRRAVDRYPDDRALLALLDALHATGPRFGALWTRYDAGPGPTGRKTVLHPELGTMELDCDVLTVDGDDLRVVLYSAPPGSRDAALLARLADDADRAAVTPRRPA